MNLLGGCKYKIYNMTCQQFALPIEGITSPKHDMVLPPQEQSTNQNKMLYYENTKRLLSKTMVFFCILLVEDVSSNWDKIFYSSRLIKVSYQDEIK